MKTLSRKKVSKGRSAKNFQNNVKRTKAANMSPPPMRGGFRL